MGVLLFKVFVIVPVISPPDNGRYPDPGLPAFGKVTVLVFTDVTLPFVSDIILSIAVNVAPAAGLAVEVVLLLVTLVKVVGIVMLADPSNDVAVAVTSPLVVIVLAVANLVAVAAKPVVFPVPPLPIGKVYCPMYDHW
jgi:hypothetical protein